jgi:hypothetical protein
MPPSSSTITPKDLPYRRPHRVKIGDEKIGGINRNQLDPKFLQIFVVGLLDARDSPLEGIDSNPRSLRGSGPSRRRKRRCQGSVGKGGFEKGEFEGNSATEKRE